MNGLRSGQVAQAAGLNQQTLRYYERRGLLAEPDRTPGGHRLYPAQTVTILRVIKAAQRLGFSLDEVADLLETGRHQHRGQTEPGLRQRAAAKLAEVEAKIADLSAIADTLPRWRRRPPPRPARRTIADRRRQVGCRRCRRSVSRTRPRPSG